MILSTVFSDNTGKYEIFINKQACPFDLTAEYNGYESPKISNNQCDSNDIKKIIDITFETKQDESTDTERVNNIVIINNINDNSNCFINSLK